ncbi:arginine--tRNA ligase, partial [Patescibacteria group bacterium]|nr:arginine--tRNA ligase [Patescibacteria group bacterium]
IIGMIRLESGKMRTRKGEIIFLEDVLNEAIERAKKIVEEKNPILKPKEKERIAKIVGIGAVKYNDLSRHPSSEIIFEWGKALNLKGNSGPYLQYTYTRAMSVLRKAKNFKIRALFKENDLKEEKEIKLLKALIHFPEIIKEAAKNYSPNLLCNYLFNLSQELNNFYEALPVLKAEKEIRLVRLALIKAVTIVLKNGLNLLGIKTLEKM